MLLRLMHCNIIVLFYMHMHHYDLTFFFLFQSRIDRILQVFWFDQIWEFFVLCNLEFHSCHQQHALLPVFNAMLQRYTETYMI